MDGGREALVELHRTLEVREGEARHARRRCRMHEPVPRDQQAGPASRASDLVVDVALRVDPVAREQLHVRGLQDPVATVALPIFSGLNRWGYFGELMCLRALDSGGATEATSRRMDVMTRGRPGPILHQAYGPGALSRRSPGAALERDREGWLPGLRSSARLTAGNYRHVLWLLVLIATDTLTRSLTALTTALLYFDLCARNTVAAGTARPRAATC